MNKIIVGLYIFGWLLFFGSVPIIWLGYQNTYWYKTCFAICSLLWFIIGAYIIFRLPPLLYDEEIVVIEKIKACVILNLGYISFLIIVTLLYAFSLEHFWGEMKDYYTIIVAGMTGAFWSLGLLEIRKKTKEIKEKSNEQILSESFQSSLRKDFIIAVFLFILFVIEMIAITLLIHR